jgi:hypothetical protein
MVRLIGDSNDYIFVSSRGIAIVDNGLRVSHFLRPQDIARQVAGG